MKMKAKKAKKVIRQKKRAKKRVLKKPMRFVKKIKVRDSNLPIEVPLERAFWVNGGPVVKNLKELHQAIEGMSPDQFLFHTTRNGNDFARWVRDVLFDPECAERLEAVGTQKEMLKIISKCL